MNVVLFGATGMVGAGVLIECLADARVTSVLVVTRTPIGRSHPKLREVQHRDFLDYRTLHGDFAGCDACFFCLGISSIGMNESDYTRITYDFARAAAREMVAANPQMTFCFVSGVGTDSSEKGSTSAMCGRVQAAYSVFAPLYPIMSRLFPNSMTRTATLGRAMIQVVETGYPKSVLYSADFNTLAAAS